MNKKFKTAGMAAILAASILSGCAGANVAQSSDQSTDSAESESVSSEAQHSDQGEETGDENLGGQELDVSEAIEDREWDEKVEEEWKSLMEQYGLSSDSASQVSSNVSALTGESVSSDDNSEGKTALERTSERYYKLLDNLLQNDPQHIGDTLMEVEIIDLNNDMSYELSVLFRQPNEVLKQEIYNMNDNEPIISLWVNKYNMYFASDRYGESVASVSDKDGKTYIVDGHTSKLYYAPAGDSKADGYPWLISSEFMDRVRGERGREKMIGLVSSMDGVAVELGSDHDLDLVSSSVVGGKMEVLHPTLKVDINRDSEDFSFQWKDIFKTCLGNYIQGMKDNKKAFEDKD